jgi:hypothetical protein
VGSGLGRGPENFSGIYAILKQKSKQNFSVKMAEPEGFLPMCRKKVRPGRHNCRLK